MRRKAPLSQWSPRFPQLCYGEYSRLQLLTLRFLPLLNRNVGLLCDTNGEKKTITYSDAQDGRLEAGSAFLSAALPLWGWERYSTTLALETVKMVLLSPHRVTLHQRKMFYLLLQKSPQLHQVTNLWLMSHFMCNYIAHVFVHYSPSCKHKSGNSPGKLRCCGKCGLPEEAYCGLLLWFNLCAVTGSTPQGLTKAETIQVKGDEQNLCATHET